MENKINSIVLMRAAAIMMVVLIHCLPDLNRGDLSEGEKIITAFIHGVLNCGVPLFLMITGALLLHRRESIKKTLQRTFRIAAVLFIFGLIMCLTEYAVTYGFSPAMPGSSILAVLSGQTWDVMWYLYMLIGVYLLMPALSTFVNCCDKKTHLYILTVLFVFNFVIAALNRQFGKIIGFYLPCGAASVFYVLMGDYLFRYKPEVNRGILCLCAFLPLFSMLAAAAVFGEFDSAAAWLEYSSPFAAVMSTALAALLMNVNTENKIIGFIAENAFGIYVIHCFYIHIINRVFGAASAEYPLYISVPLTFAAVLVLSAASSCVLRRVKPFKALL